MSVFRWTSRWIGAVLAGVLAVASPAQAQFSDGYKFLEAVKKKDLAKVNEMLAGPGAVLVNTRDVTTEQTALHLTTQRRDRPWMAEMIRRGADVNARDRNGVTPLVLAVNLGFVEGVELLVEYRARVDDSNDAGETPLISAVHRRHTELARLLLKAGADPDRKDNSGRSARDYASVDSSGAQMLAEIAAHAKPKAQQPGRKVYGPVL